MLGKSIEIWFLHFFLFSFAVCHGIRGGWQKLSLSRDTKDKQCHMILYFPSRIYDLQYKAVY
jgi:hypothetical protein